MRSVVTTACAFLGFACILHADQVTLKNGDRITGKLVKKEGKSLKIKSDIIGEVTIPWKSVVGIETDAEVTVVMPDETSVIGKISTEEDRLQVDTPAGPQDAIITDVKAIRNTAEQIAFERLINPRLLDLWTGHIDFGLSLTRGNADTSTVTTALKTSRETRSDKMTLYFNQIFSRAEADLILSTTAQAVRGGWSYNKNVSTRMLVNVFNDYEYDRFQNLDLRFVSGGGAGFIAIKSDRQQLDLLGGANYNRESFATGLHRDSAEGYWGDDWTYQLNGVTSLRQNLRIFNNLTNRGEYRVNFDISSATSLRKWLALQLTLSDRYLSNPVEGRQRNDILFTTGIRFSFAR